MLTEGTVFADRYEILNPISSGGTSNVYRARDRELGRDVAVKILSLHASLSEDARERFRREARAMAGLTHPGIVTVFDTGESDGHPYLILELVEGRDFKGVISDGSVDRNGKLRLLAQAARGLQAAHDKGVIHRDVKPANILVTKDDQAKVTDFGLVQLATETSDLTRTGSFLGTPLYMAPEQADSPKKVSHRTDIYGLGAILYEILAGKVPRQASTQFELMQQIAKEDLPAPRLVNPQTPPDLEAVCIKATERSPAHRYETAAAFADDIENYLRNEPVSARPPSITRRIVRALRRQRRIQLAIAAIFLAAGGALIALTLGGRRAEPPPVFDESSVHLDSARQMMKKIDRLLTSGEDSPEDVRKLTDQARRELDKILSRNSKHAAALLEMARTHASDHDLTGAVDWCTKSIEAAPEFASAYIERAQLNLVRYGNLRLTYRGTLKPDSEQAIRVWEQILADLAEARKTSGDSAELAFAEGMERYGRGDFAGAASALQKYAESSVADHRGWFWAAMAWSQLGRHEECLQAVEKALRFRRGHVPSLALRGNLHRIAADKARFVGEEDEAVRLWEESRKDYDAALLRNPNFEAGLVNRGDIHYLRGRYQKAMDDFNRVLTLNPTSPPALVNRGITRIALGDLDAAIQDFSEAIRNDPAYGHAYVNRGNAFMERGDRQESWKDYNVAERLSPHDADLFHNRGVLYMRERKLPEAIREFDRTLKLNPRHLSALNSRGETRLMMRKFREAVLDFDSALGVAPKSVRALLGRAAGRSYSGDLDGAIEDYDEAIRLEPKHALHRCKRGIVSAAAGDYESALEDQNEALRLDPKMADAWMARAQVRIKTKDWDGARTDLKKVMELTEPDSPMHQYAKRTLPKLGD